MRRALALAGLLAAPAVGQEPPPSPDQMQAITASCGASSGHQAMPFDQVAATVTPLSPATLPITGRLHARWGLRIATRDPRVADLTGLEISNAYGLLGVTRGGQWLSFGLRDGTLARINAVGVAAMRQAPGVPTSLVAMLDGPTLVAFGGAKPGIVSYGLPLCGAAATAVPWMNVSGTSEPVIVEAAWNYLGIVGRHVNEGSVLASAVRHGTVTLVGRNPLATRGETLIAASNPARIVPEIIVARRRPNGQTDVSLVSVEAWDDVRGGPPRPETPLATLPRAPGAMASLYFSRDRTTLVILAYPGPRAGTLDLYAFDTDVAL